MNTRPLERITEAYNPEFDVIPGGPNVTWAANDLAEFVMALVKRVEELEKKSSAVTPVEVDQ